MANVGREASFSPIVPQGGTENKKIDSFDLKGKASSLMKRMKEGITSSRLGKVLAKNKKTTAVVLLALATPAVIALPHVTAIGGLAYLGVVVGALIGGMKCFTIATK